MLGNAALIPQPPSRPSPSHLQPKGPIALPSYNCRSSISLVGLPGGFSAALGLHSTENTGMERDPSAAPASQPTSSMGMGSDPSAALVSQPTGSNPFGRAQEASSAAPPSQGTDSPSLQQPSGLGSILTHNCRGSTSMLGPATSDQQASMRRGSSCFLGPTTGEVGQSSIRKSNTCFERFPRSFSTALATPRPQATPVSNAVSQAPFDAYVAHAIQSKQPAAPTTALARPHPATNSSPPARVGLKSSPSTPHLAKALARLLHSACSIRVATGSVGLMGDYAARGEGGGEGNSGEGDLGEGGGEGCSAASAEGRAAGMQLSELLGPTPESPSPPTHAGSQTPHPLPLPSYKHVRAQLKPQVAELLEGQPHCHMRARALGVTGAGQVGMQPEGPPPSELAAHLKPQYPWGIGSWIRSCP